MYERSIVPGRGGKEGRKEGKKTPGGRGKGVKETWGERGRKERDIARRGKEAGENEFN